MKTRQLTLIVAIAACFAASPIVYSTAAIGADPLKLRVDPVASRPDATCRIILLRESVARAK